MTSSGREMFAHNDSLPSPDNLTPESSAPVSRQGSRPPTRGATMGWEDYEMKNSPIVKDGIGAPLSKVDSRGAGIWGKNDWQKGRADGTSPVSVYASSL